MKMGWQSLLHGKMNLDLGFFGNHSGMLVLLGVFWGMFGYVFMCCGILGYDKNTFRYVWTLSAML